MAESDMMEVLKILAPGTQLRDGLENILNAKTGALIVIGDSQEVLSLVDGGFYINKDYSPTYIYELAKMDGAVILSKDLKKILYANAMLIPNSTIPSEETGTRHKTADRVAKQTRELVISISSRRSIITLYKGNKKYILKDAASVLTRANQALQTLEKYKTVLDNSLTALGRLEFEDEVTLEDVLKSFQRVEMVSKMASEIEGYICELGTEGRLVQMQLTELMNNVEDEELRLIDDYMIEDAGTTSIDYKMSLKRFSYAELMDLANIAKVFGYTYSANLDTPVSPKGYRLLCKIQRLPHNIVNNLVERFSSFQSILNASEDELDDVDGIGEMRIKAIKDGLQQLGEQLLLEDKRLKI
ncbi:MAG: DNA integrity scanning diadenylate cyclase DisA [Clostridiales bacterium]|nr:DNA integrity scanning diadenylate cyclase DisA [Clostridiales bacterium]